MADQLLILNNFTAGEWSPRLSARIDMAKFANSCQKLQNFLVHPHGGASRRSGTRYVATLKNEEDDCTLLPFVFSTDDAYILELGQESGGNTGYARFYRNGGAIYSGSTPYELATPFTAHHFEELRWIQSGDIVFMCHPELPAKALVRSGHTNWSIGSIGFLDGPYRLYEKGVKVTPAGSTTYGDQCKLISDAALFSSNMISVHLRWNEGYTWYWFTLDTFHSVTKMTGTIMGWEDSEGNIPLTAYSAGTVRIGAWGNHAGYPRTLGFFEQRLVFGGCGSSATAQPDLQSLWATVTAEYGETCLMSPGIFDDSGVTYTLDSDTQDAIKWITGSKRLVVGTEGSEWVHQASDIEPMTPGNVRFVPESPRGSASQPALRADNSIVFVGKHHRKVYEWTYVYADDRYKAVDLSVLAEHITEGNMGSLHWVQDPDSIVWSVRGDGVLLGMTYMREEDVVAWHRHPTQGLFKRVAVIPGDGRDQPWLVAERTLGNTTHRYIELMEKGAGSDVTQSFYVDSGLTYEDDKAFLSAVTQTIGSTVYPWIYTEAWSAITAGDTVHLLGLASAGSGWAGLNDKTYTLLSGFVYGNTTYMKLGGVDASAFSAWAGGGSVYREASTLSGLDHLEGKTVAVLNSGGAHPDRTVSGGQITLQAPGWRVHVGLSFDSELITQRLEYPVQGGTSQGAIKFSPELTVRFYRTIGAEVGFSGHAYETLPWRSSEDLMDRPLALKDNIDKKVTPDTGAEEEIMVKVRQSWPLPCSVLGIFARVETEG